MKGKYVLHWALHTGISKWVHVTFLWLKKTMKSTSDKFVVTRLYGRWPSIRNRIVIPDLPDNSKLRTEISGAYQPKGIILCGITAFIPTASSNAFAVLTGTVCLVINRWGRQIKKWWQLRRCFLIVKVELGWSGGILEGISDGGAPAGFAGYLLRGECRKDQRRCYISRKKGMKRKSVIKTDRWG